MRAFATLRRKSDQRWTDPGSLNALLQKTDQEHWADPRSLHPSWEPRTRIAAGFVPDGSRVIEFGAGNRLLEKHLDSSCTYTPSDLVDRGPGTIVCDLNERPLPDLGTDTYDTAVILGVLEYLTDVPSLIDWLGQHVPMCVISYACADLNSPRLRDRLRTVSRLNMGWMNSFTAAEFQNLFSERGFELLRTDDWERQRVFVFSQNAHSA